MEFYSHSFLVGKIPFRDDRAPLLKKYLAETELFAISGTKILKPFHSYKSGARPLSSRKQVFPMRNEWMKNLVIRDPDYKKGQKKKIIRFRLQSRNPNPRLLLSWYNTGMLRKLNKGVLYTTIFLLLSGFLIFLSAALSDLKRPDFFFSVFSKQILAIFIGLVFMFVVATAKRTFSAR